MMEASSVLEESLCIEDKDSLENHFDAPMGIAEAVIFESLDNIIADWIALLEDGWGVIDETHFF